MILIHLIHSIELSFQFPATRFEASIPSLNLSLDPSRISSHSPIQTSQAPTVVLDIACFRFFHRVLLFKVMFSLVHRQSIGVGIWRPGKEMDG